MDSSTTGTSTASATTGEVGLTGRRAAAVAAAVVCLAHLPLIPEHLEEAPYIGWLFIALCVVSAALAVALWRADSTRVWQLLVLTMVAALIAYLISRTVGLPEISDDIGNWTELPSFPALAGELVAIVFGVVRLTSGHRPVR